MRNFIINARKSLNSYSVANFSSLLEYLEKKDIGSVCYGIVNNPTVKEGLDKLNDHYFMKSKYRDELLYQEYMRLDNYYLYHDDWIMSISGYFFQKYPEILKSFHKRGSAMREDKIIQSDIKQFRDDFYQKIDIEMKSVVDYCKYRDKNFDYMYNNPDSDYYKALFLTSFLTCRLTCLYLCQEMFEERTNPNFYLNEIAYKENIMLVARSMDQLCRELKDNEFDKLIDVYKEGLIHEYNMYDQAEKNYKQGRGGEELLTRDLYRH